MTDDTNHPLPTIDPLAAIEALMGLHVSVEIHDAVDSYWAEIVREDLRVLVTGPNRETIREALVALGDQVQGKTRCHDCYHIYDAQTYHDCKGGKCSCHIDAAKCAYHRRRSPHA